jgi:hypothetical protein
MYKTAVRALVRFSIAKLNDGDPGLLLRLASPEVELAFPGDNSWAAMHRPVRRGRHRHVTHRGIDECRAFAERFVAVGLCLVIEDILVNGPPWNLRVAVRAHDYLAYSTRGGAEHGGADHDPGGADDDPGCVDNDGVADTTGDGRDDVYNNRVVAFLEMRWGRLVAWEDYEDTERIVRWEARVAGEGSPGGVGAL